MIAAPPPRPRTHVPPWRDVRVLRILAQLGALAVVLVAGYVIWTTLAANMAAARLSVGFDFLRARAGFDISQSVIPYSPNDSYGHAFLAGLLNTLLVSAVGVVLATLLGIVVGVARLSENWLVRKLASGYVELMRNTPLLVQLALIYAVFLTLPTVANSITLPGPVYLNQRGLVMPRPVAEDQLTTWALVVVLGIVGAILGSRLSSRRRERGLPTYAIGRLTLLAALILPIVGYLLLRPFSFDVPVQDRFNFNGGVVISPPFAALLIGLVIYTAAFIGEVVRGGIQAVRRGQLEAAYAIGLTPRQTLRLIVFPQALRIIVPPLTSQYLNLTKNSSLAIAVGFPDLFAVSRTMANQTGAPVSVIVLVMSIYLALSILTSLFMNLYNRRVQVLER